VVGTKLGTVELSVLEGYRDGDKPASAASIFLSFLWTLWDYRNREVVRIVNVGSISNLPLNRRNFTFLAQLAAGVKTPPGDGTGQNR